MNKSVSISVPHRTSISVVNMNAFSPGIPGAGNIGFSLDLRTSVELTRSAKRSVLYKRQTPVNRRHEIEGLIDHILSYKNLEFNFTAIIDTLEFSHIGLASNVAFQLSFLTAIKYLEDKDIDLETIRREVIYHYKEFVNDKLVDGFTTGLSSYLNLIGGFAYINPQMEIVYHKPLPVWNYFIVVDKEKTDKSFGYNEINVLMGEGRRLDSKDLNTKIELINKGIIPSVEKGNIVEFGNYVRLIQEIGSKKAEKRIYGERIEHIINALYDVEKIECSFLSALGPGIVILSMQPACVIKESTERLGLQTIYSGLVDNSGIGIEVY